METNRSQLGDDTAIGEEQRLPNVPIGRYDRLQGVPPISGSPAKQHGGEHSGAGHAAEGEHAAAGHAAGGEHGSGIHLASWRWSEYSSHVMFTGT